MIESATVEEAPTSDAGGTARGWCSALFLDAPLRPFTWRAGLVAAVVAVVGTLTSLARTGGVGALDTVWAEDGRIFLADAVNTPFSTALATRYAGYYQLVPRLLAEPARVLPVHWLAEYYAVAAACVTTLFALVIYVASAAYFRSTLARLVAAAIAVVPPVAMQDIPNALTNLHWPGLYAMFWLLLWVPSGRAGRIVAAVLVPMLAATNILVVVFVPLALARAAVRRDWHSRFLGVAVAAGVLLHLLGLAIGSTQRPIQPTLAEPARTFMMQVVPGGLLGQTWLGQFYAPMQHQWLMTVLAWLIVLAVVTMAATRRTRPRWSLAALAGGYSFVFWMVATGTTGLIAPRYASTAGMLLVTALLALLLPEPLRWSTGPVAAFATLLAVVCAVNLQVPTPRANGPRWSTEVEAARAECKSTHARAVMVPHAPGGLPDWRVNLPCSYLMRRWGALSG